MVSSVQDFRIIIFFFLLLTFFSFSPPFPSVYVLVILRRETQDYSPRKKDICFGCQLEGGQEQAVEDNRHRVDNKSRAKFNEWVLLMVGI